MRPRRDGIIGGVPAVNTTLPALAYVRVRWGRVVIQCTGTLVAPNAILTAAHCVENRAASKVAAATQLRVLVGRLDGASLRHPGLRVGRVVTFDSSHTAAEGADVALLIMNMPIALPPIHLASEDQWSSAPRAEMIGWSIGELLPSAILSSQFSMQEKVTAQTFVQTPEWCEDEVDSFSRRYNMCAIDPPSYSTGGCVGDSGGPLVASNTRPSIEIGMVIRGAAGCSPRRPTVFIRIDAVRGWIMAQLSAVSRLKGNRTSATDS